MNEKSIKEHLQQMEVDSAEWKRLNELLEVMSVKIAKVPWDQSEQERIERAAEIYEAQIEKMFGNNAKVEWESKTPKELKGWIVPVINVTKCEISFDPAIFDITNDPN